MTSADAVGYAAATLTTLSFVPQVIRTWRSKSAGDLSFTTLVAFTLGIALWLVYGLLVWELPVIAANAVTLLLTSVLVGLKVRHGRHAK